MFCEKCGKELAGDAKFCGSCGIPVGSSSSNQAPQQEETPMQHDIPKCTCCGHIGPWKVGPILRPIDFVIGIILLVLGFIPGLVYFGVVATIRLNEKNREKTCTKCNARNLFTFVY